MTRAQGSPKTVPNQLRPGSARTVSMNVRRHRPSLRVRATPRARILVPTPRYGTSLRVLDPIYGYRSGPSERFLGAIGGSQFDTSRLAEDGASYLLINVGPRDVVNYCSTADRISVCVLPETFLCICVPTLAGSARLTPISRVGSTYCPDLRAGHPCNLAHSRKERAEGPKPLPQVLVPPSMP